jgi:hypothetical protein
MNSKVLNVKELERKLEQQIDQINGAIIKVRRNILVDISFMDTEVAELCQTILKAEGMAAKRLEPKMIEMINKLDDLAMELKDYQDRINPRD